MEDTAAVWGLLEEPNGVQERQVYINFEMYLWFLIKLLLHADGSSSEWVKCHCDRVAFVGDVAVVQLVEVLSQVFLEPYQALHFHHLGQCHDTNVVALVRVISASQLY